MWEINNTAQIFAFLYSLCLGCIFCLFYDFFRAFRFAVKLSDFSIFLSDIFYFLTISFVTFIFLLGVTNGELRGFVFFGVLLGFLICYFTVSRFFIRFLKFIIKNSVKIFNKFNLVLNNFFSKADNFITKNLIFIKNTFKKGLKKVKGLLYTKK